MEDISWLFVLEHTVHFDYSIKCLCLNKCSLHACISITCCLLHGLGDTLLHSIRK